MGRVDGGKDSVLTREGLPDEPGKTGNPCREARLSRQESAEAIVLSLRRQKGGRAEHGERGAHGRFAEGATTAENPGRELPTGGSGESAGDCGSAERPPGTDDGATCGDSRYRLNEEKSAVDYAWRRKILGFSFTWEREPRIRLAPQTVKRFKQRIRWLTKRSRSVNMAERLARLNEYLKGWMGYFRLIETPSTLQALDEWIRRRLRMCLLKQWKRPRTRRRNLVALGIPEDWACLISGSRKGCWRLANTPQVNKALGLAYWRSQGLVSLVDRYRELRSAS